MTYKRLLIYFTIIYFFVSLLIINRTFPIMYRCICGRTQYVIVYVKYVNMCDLQIMLNSIFVSLYLKVR
jgi:hypothetical protein